MALKFKTGQLVFAEVQGYRALCIVAGYSNKEYDLDVLCIHPYARRYCRIDKHLRRKTRYIKTAVGDLHSCVGIVVGFRHVKDNKDAVSFVLSQM